MIMTRKSENEHHYLARQSYSAAAPRSATQAAQRWARDTRGGRPLTSRLGRTVGKRGRRRGRAVALSRCHRRHSSGCPAPPPTCSRSGAIGVDLSSTERPKISTITVKTNRSAAAPRSAETPPRRLAGGACNDWALACRLSPAVGCRHQFCDIASAMNAPPVAP
jgi:hypothetical protein